MATSTMEFDTPVFAYGSNLLVSQMRDRSVRWDPERVVIGRLNNHKLVFRGESTRTEYEGCGLADLDVEAGAHVTGVIYWTDGQLDGLDHGEGVFLRYPKGCCRIQTLVQTKQGPVACQTYVRKAKESLNAPHHEYLDRIIRGAIDHGLPSDWIEEIRNAARASEAEIT